ncbi:hypothetical protein PROFUN_13377 [Planoprotostelium fungivorum]|uniref:SET domain-containing protein n=1 Tax=Planoprotostelium fungivorum TaxID=1890364 RepID=A0A2P6MZQ8_9EUKA|nr:hypothetical protein PROFUN_13377 [Planoprotostelium fungivorum]
MERAAVAVTLAHIPLSDICSVPPSISTDPSPYILELTGIHKHLRINLCLQVPHRNSCRHDVDTHLRSDAEDHAVENASVVDVVRPAQAPNMAPSAVAQPPSGRCLSLPSAWLQIAWTTVIPPKGSSWMFMALKCNSQCCEVLIVLNIGATSDLTALTDLILSVMAELRGSNTYPPQNAPLSEGPRQKKPKGEPPVVQEIDEAQFNTFLDWAVKNGARFPKIKYVRFPLEGRGGLAVDDINADEEMCSVPMNMLIWNQTVRASQVAIAAKPLLEQANIGTEEQQWSLWYVYILHEKGRAQTTWLSEPASPPSFWTPYFQILPEDITTPLSFTEEELEMLKGTNLPDATRKIKIKLRTIYDTLFPALFESHPKLFQKNLFTWKHFTWAYQVFWSRALSVIIDNVQQAAMVPLSDMLNHSSDVVVSYFSEVHSDRFILKTFSAVSKGYQVYNNFGPRSNEKLLLNFGFVIRDNFADNFFVRLGMSQQDPLYHSKNALLTQHNLGFEHYITKRHSNSIDASLLNALRITLMNEAELYFFRADGEKRMSTTGHIFVSPRNEWLVFTTLKKLLHNKFSVFDTSIEHDKKLLEDKLNEAQWLSVVCRLGQKEIIQNAIDHSIPALLAEFNRKLTQFPGYREFRGTASKAGNKEKVTPQQSQYEQWLHSNATFHPSVTFSSVMGERRLVTTADLPEGSDVITFPYKSVISAENILQDEINKDLSDILKKNKGIMGEEQILLTFLMDNKRRNNSKWASFFKTHPPLTSPVLFSEPELSELENTYLFEEVHQLRMEYEQEAQSLFSLLSEMKLQDPSHNLENFLWARVFLESKAVAWEAQGRVESVILPLLPLPVHKYASLSRVTLPRESNMKIQTLVGYSADSVIMEGTNGRANHQLFLDCGVVMENNDDDTLSFVLNLGNDHTRKREEILRKFDIGMEHFLKVGQISPQLLSAVRVCVMNRNEINAFDVTSAASHLNFITKRNELQMVETLTGLLEGMLSGYATTAEQDAVVLAKTNIHKHRRLSTFYRRGQKHIIDSALSQLLTHHATING